MNPHTLTVLIDDKIMLAHTPPPELTIAGYDGFVNGDTVGDLDTPVELRNDATEGSPPLDPKNLAYCLTRFVPPADVNQKRALTRYRILVDQGADANYKIVSADGYMFVLPHCVFVAPVIQ